MNQVIFVMSHAPHCPYLLASLYTLRKHYDGPVKVFAWKGALPIVLQMLNDPRLDIVCCSREPAYYGKNDQFLDKIRVVQSQGEGVVSLYLDADTTIHGSIDPLFQIASDKGFCATQFNDWFVGGRGIINGRINTLRDFSEIPASAFDLMESRSWPSVNGGVWSAQSNSPLLPLWYDWTYAAKSTYIADEKVLHLLAARFHEIGQCGYLRGGAYNCSPIQRYQPKNLRDEDVVIRHYHGDSNVRPDNKSQRGYEMWWPIWEECQRLNLGSVNDWKDSVNNKWMNALKARVV